MKHFLSAKDVPDPSVLVREALALKANPFQYENLGKHKTLALLFFNPSLRTRLSTQKAASHLGMHVMSMDVGRDTWRIEFQDGVVMNGESQEHVKEAARVVSQYCDILGIRTFPTLSDREADYSEHVMSQFVKYATVPIVSLESATMHPLQSLADWMTVEEFKTAPRPKVVLTWAPHPRSLPQAVPNSFVDWMKLADVDLVVTHPEGFELEDSIVKGVKVVYDQKQALSEADFVYVKNWSSYRHYGQNWAVQPSWTVNQEKMDWTNNAYLMHCLPVRRNVVVGEEVLDGPRSLVVQQANNRTFAAQAVLKRMLESL